MIIPETINSFDNEPFWGCLWMGGQKVPLPKIFHAYPLMIKLGTVIPYLRKIKKENYMTQPLISHNIRFFSPAISNFCFMKIYTDIDCIVIHNFYFF